MEKKYTSEMNYRNPEFKAGSVFTESQWVAKRGTVSSLQEHLAAGYITEWEGQSAPTSVQAPAVTKTANSANTEVVESESAEDSNEEESEEEVVVEESEQTEQEKPHGIWDFKAEDLEPLGLPALNTMYKEHAEKNGIDNVRAFQNKENLIEKMCSEA